MLDNNMKIVAPAWDHQQWHEKRAFVPRERGVGIDWLVNHVYARLFIVK